MGETEILLLFLELRANPPFKKLIDVTIRMIESPRLGIRVKNEIPPNISQLCLYFFI